MAINSGDSWVEKDNRISNIFMDILEEAQ